MKKQSESLRRLRKLQDVNTQFNDVATVLYFMVLSRQTLENHQDQNFPLIKFYADWCVHSRKDVITASMKRIMEEIYHALTYGHGLAAQKRQGSAMAKFISFQDFHAELNKFLEKYSITNLSLYQYLDFVKHMQQLLVMNPLFWPHEKIESFIFLNPPKDKDNRADIIGKIIFEDLKGNWKSIAMPMWTIRVNNSKPASVNP